MQLQQIDTYPEALLSCEAKDLHALFPEPTLLHLPGKNPHPLFISALLHGNETTGFRTVQRLLNQYAQQRLPRSLSIFFGNTRAAALGLRRLDSQPDFNRIWPGTDIANCPETQMASQIVEIMRAKNVFASIDIHNNTGLNPHYACINKLDNRYLQLANLFGRLVVYFLRPLGVQSAAFAELCPAVTLECGRPAQQYGVDHAYTYLKDCLHLTELATHPVHMQDIDLFHTTAQVKIKQDSSFSFSDCHAELLFDAGIDRMNFTEISAGSCLGSVQTDNTMPIFATDEHGVDVTKQFFKIVNKQLQIKRNTMPSMLTLDERVIRQDCLCYLMERIQIEYSKQ
ncbi:peptidase M14 [Methyloprofundus sedimenti]|uniref:Peptidase M14 n=1 Tax=Methyloprofundus sedimenti TaxID=1420851 RepID=A0A1V8M755_9GAMM|nr:M14 family metallopeptidase [Methyloprofundus sedimenti]OQK17379.1 peptidase M14 [Methyloprofundus sedimenti]